MLIAIIKKFEQKTQNSDEKWDEIKVNFHFFRPKGDFSVQWMINPGYFKTAWIKCRLILKQEKIAKDGMYATQGSRPEIRAT
jgi:hypothetical protein